MNQYQITSRPRHLRYIYFIDEKYPYSDLGSLINTNQRLWGGRFNPIIPVKDNIISERYLALLKHYDPDYIFYSNNVDPEIIKRLRIFNPCVYCNLDEQPRKEDITGVDAFYFLSQFEPTAKIILPTDLWKTESPLLDFYKLNFGLHSNGIVSDYEIGKAYNQTIITTSNFEKLNEIIHTEKPVNQAQLSKRNINTRILRNLQHTRYNDFEIVVAKDKSLTDDLLYFWNRHLFGGKNILYITLEELELLALDKFFGGVLYDLSSENTISIASMTLTKEEVEDIIKTKLNPIAFQSRFIYKTIDNFPFEILDSNGLFERDYGEAVTTQTLISENGLFHIPKLSFTNKVGFYPQKWAIDIEIKKSEDNYQNQIEFPFTTETQYIVKGVKGRINRSRNISIFIHNQQNTSSTLDLGIPNFSNLIRQLISRPIIHGEAAQTKFIDIGPHDASNRLKAFIQSFKLDFTAIDDFFTDKFWVSIFEYLCTNDKVAGDSILLEEIKLKCIELFTSNGIVLGKREETYKNEENLEMGIKRTLSELCDYRVFLKGFNLKCKKCSSEFWYHIKDVSEIINCKGCLQDFSLPIEPKFAYKLNDLIKNNIYQTKTNRDGNLTVIRTLVSLKKRSNQSFQYSPQVNLYDNHHSNKPCSEIDIICLSDGKLIIGEAKHNSAAFSIESNKSLKSLVEVAKAIYPDKIILSCYENSNTKLEKAKQGLIHIFNGWEYQPEIETLLLHDPDYFHLNGHRYFYN
jgi:hypothetical protein